MKKFSLFLPLGLCVHSVWACGTGPTSVEWNGWALKSNEMHWVGVTHNGMPLYNLVDGDTKTACVWSGYGNRMQSQKSPKTLFFVSDKPFWVDEVRILNGYDKSEALWKRNNRVKTMRITRDGDESSTWGRVPTAIKDVTLKNRRGWHRISLPRQNVLGLGLDILSEYQGRDNDLCLSEVAFYDRGHKLDFHLPRAVAVSDGFIDAFGSKELEAAKKLPGYKVPFPDSLIDRVSGRVLGELNNEEEPLFSPDGSLVCAIAVDRNERWVLARVFNASSSRQVWRRRFNLSGSSGWPRLSWESPRRLKVERETQKQGFTLPQFVQFR